MKRRLIMKFMALLLVCCAMLGCEKESNEPVVTPQSTTIYGTVFNSVTHEPVIGAEVEIGQNWTAQTSFGSIYNNKISSSISGSDGQFELQFGELSDYDHFYMAASCNGYKNYYSRADFGMGSGSFRVDINLDPY